MAVVEYLKSIGGLGQSEQIRTINNKKGKQKNFPSLDSLKSVEKVVNEANRALNNPTFTINDSAIPEVLAGALGAGIGYGGSFLALKTLGVAGLSGAGITSGLAAAGAVVGGGMVAGIGVLAAPAVILAAVGVGVASAVRRGKLMKEKSRLFAKATETLHAIVEALKNEVDMVKERADLLNAYNITLTAAIKDLREDLSI